MMKWFRKKARRNIREWFDGSRKKFGTVPKPEDPNALAKGRLLFVEGKAEPVLVERVTGNINDPKKFEVNGTDLISMLEFYAQVKENRRPSAEELAEWDSIEVLQVDAPEAPVVMRKRTGSKKKKRKVKYARNLH